ncbi:hypothetical protein ACIBH1_45325 [Nonomuraea sp. NPDC050663]|uniref:hypothetical protein n=1 Tax=Nonomuraea sp. NPDC050663 TaxID=3364370 RepID=UPI00378A672A
MTMGRVTAYAITCDTEGCPLGAANFDNNLDDLRAYAAAQGWTRCADDRDHCPDHSPRVQRTFLDVLLGRTR